MYDAIYSLAVWLLFLIFCLSGTKAGRAVSVEDYIRRLNAFRGIFALEIVIGHVVRYERSLLYPLGKMMIVSVAFFFFVSAFGMVSSFRRREDYLKGFLVSKVLYLVILAAITYAVNLLLDWLCHFQLFYYVPDTNIISAAVSKTNWYINELILLYLLFYVVYKYIKRFRVLVVTVVCLLFATAVFLNGWIQGWYASILAFPAGLLFGEYFDAILGFMETIWGKIITVMLFLLGGCSLFLDESSLFGMVYLRNIMCIAGVLLLIYFCSCFETGNRANRLTGKYSTEIYLFQFGYLSISARNAMDYKVRLPFVLAATFLTAAALHPLTGFVKKRLRAFQGQRKP